jgi:nucleoside-diphosphate-sugar epimerase
MEVAGGMKGVIPERFITERRKFLNTYEAAKAETEDFLRALSEEEFPVTIYRPTMVVGDSITGKAIKFQSFYHLVEDMCISPPSPVMPCRPDWRLDTVPVDFVAKVIASTYDSGGTGAKIYNVAAGADNAVSLSELLDKLKITLEGLTGRRLKVPRVMPPSIFYVLLHILRTFSFGAAKKKIDYQINILKFMFLDQRFENTAMKSEIEKVGLGIPKISEYLSVICGYYLKNRKNR